MTIDEMVDAAFIEYGNEVIDKSYIDEQISAYISADGNIHAEDLNDDEIDEMFRELFESEE